MSIRPHYPFLQQLAWQTQAANALQYNTSQPGSVIPMSSAPCGCRRPACLWRLYGAGRRQEAKGSGPCRLAARHGRRQGRRRRRQGKGGKKGRRISIDVDFGLCQGPIDHVGLAFVNASVADFASVGLNIYNGVDGQAADGTFAMGDVVGYSAPAISPARHWIPANRR